MPRAFLKPCFGISFLTAGWSLAIMIAAMGYAPASALPTPGGVNLVASVAEPMDQSRA